MPNHISIHDLILQTTEPAIMIAGFIIAGCIIANTIIASPIITGISFIATTLVEYNRPPDNRTSVRRLECLT